MPSKVLLRGFAPDIPEDQTVTFFDDLPVKATCAQCDNVSAVLHRDPVGHGYCTSCMKMCTIRENFQCPECNRRFPVSQLNEDRSVREKIKAMKIFCPKIIKGKPVLITFNALKAHLKHCSCDQAVDTPTDVDQPTSLPQSSVKMVRCPHCNEAFPKKAVRDHMKVCKGSQKPMSTQLQPASCPEVAKQMPAVHEASDQSSDFSHVGIRNPPSNQPSPRSTRSSLVSKQGTFYFSAQSAAVNDVTMKETPEKHSIQESSHGKPRPDEIPPSDEKPSRIPLDDYAIGVQLNDFHREICDLKDEVAKLREELSIKNNDYEFLAVTVKTIQEDMRNVQIACEQRIAKVEKATSNLEESHNSLQGTVSEIRENAGNRAHVVEQAMENLNEHVASSINSLLDVCTRLREDMDRGFFRVNQSTQDLRQEFLNIVQNFLVPGQEQNELNSEHH